MKELLKPIIEALSRDANQLEHHAQKLRKISPNLSLDIAQAIELLQDDDVKILSTQRSRPWTSSQ